LRSCSSPAADIPRFVGEGRVDLGITGRDQVAEAQSDVEELLDLGFGRCKLQVQVPEKGEYREPSQLIGRNICTSFTGLAGEYFEKLERESGKKDAAARLDLLEVDEVKGGSRSGSRMGRIATKIKYVGGSVEAACALGVADGIVDLVGESSAITVRRHGKCTNGESTESGETMKAAGLKPIATILETTAILIKSKHPSNPQLINTIESRIRGVITAKKYILCTYNILRSKIVAASAITPGKRAPTITQLDEQGWVAVSAMVEKRAIATVMDRLEEIGAHDVLVMPITNSRTNRD
jgi:ATP phosphoribosyltransferase